jgi:hypothetical protein
MTAPPIRKHQIEGIEWIQRVKRGLLADEPGLGKTRQAIEAFDHLPRKLVVAPKLVIEGGTWEDELERWSADPSSWVIVPYTSLNGRKQVGERASTTKPVKVLKEEVKGKWDAVVFDEAHYLKGRDTPTCRRRTCAPRKTATASTPAGSRWTASESMPSATSSASPSATGPPMTWKPPPTTQI